MYNAKILTRICAALIVALVATAASARDTRAVYINGTRLNLTQLANLDSINCATPVPSGRYWINWNNFAWGFEGDDTTQGTLGECVSSAPAAQPQTAGAQGASCEAKYRYYEDRMCYCHNVCGLNF